MLGRWKEGGRGQNDLAERRKLKYKFQQRNDISKYEAYPCSGYWKVLRYGSILKFLRHVRSGPKQNKFLCKITREISNYQRCPLYSSQANATSTLHTREESFTPWRIIARKSLETWGNQALERKMTRCTDIRELTTIPLLTRATSIPLLLFSSQNIERSRQKIAEFSSGETDESNKTNKQTKPYYALTFRILQWNDYLMDK